MMTQQVIFTASLDREIASVYFCDDSLPDQRGDIAGYTKPAATATPVRVRWLE